MSRYNGYSEEELYEGDMSGYIPSDAIGEMGYYAKKQKRESSVTTVAKAVLVVACIGLICAMIDCYIEEL